MNNEVFQQHHGSGDNVARDKIVNVIQELAPESLSKVIAKILAHIRDGNKDTAKLMIATIQDTEQTNKEANTLLDILSVHCELIDSQDVPQALGRIISKTKHISNSIVKDLGLSAILKLSRKEELAKAATDLYKENTNPGTYAKQAYYSLYAESDELRDIFAKQKLSLSEEELIGIIKGLIRTKEIDLLVDAADLLQELYASFSSRIYKLFSDAFKINKLGGCRS